MNFFYKYIYRLTPLSKMTICCCCGEDESNYIRCVNNHTTCADCIENGTKSAIGNMEYLKCPDSRNCGVIIDESQISKVISNYLLKTYSNNIAFLAVKDIDNLHKCNVCDYAVIIEGEIVEFYCHGCNKIYCKCKKDLHPGVPCNAEIYAEAEALTDQYVIRCNCGFGLVKQDACNHITCTQCNTNWCWYCKRKYVDFSHESCPAYDEPPIQDATASSANIAERLRELDPFEKARVAQQEQRLLTNEALARIEQVRFNKLALERERNEAIEYERQARIKRNQLAQLELDRVTNLDRVTRAKLEYERAAKLEQARLDRIEQERLEILTRKRLAQEHLEREQERLEKMERDRIIRLGREQLTRSDRDRLANPAMARAEQARLAKLERERVARLKRELAEKLERERVERARLAKLERERLATLEHQRISMLSRRRSGDAALARFEQANKSTGLSAKSRNFIQR